MLVLAGSQRVVPGPASSCERGAAVLRHAQGRPLSPSKRRAPIAGYWRRAYVGRRVLMAVVGRAMANVASHSITLPDRRVVTYTKFGDLNGQPVMYFHGWPGSRLEAELVDRAANKAGALIIAVDRPGMGGSDFQRGRRILDWADDVVALADALRVERFAVLGFSGGGPYALACAHAVPERLSAAATVAGVSPLDAPNGTLGMSKQNRRTFRLARAAPWLLRPMFALMGIGLRRRPDRVLDHLAAPAPAADRAVLQQSETRRVVIASLREAVRQGARGVAYEGRLFARPWGFRLEDVGSQVFLWQGEEDVNVPLAMGQSLAGSFPRCHATYCPDEGHFSLLVNRLPDILASLVD
jgi:pimeloyl-ACP methyl ester carboxylesterase